MLWYVIYEPKLGFCGPGWCDNAYGVTKPKTIQDKIADTITSSPGITRLTNSFT